MRFVAFRELARVLSPSLYQGHRPDTLANRMSAASIPQAQRTFLGWDQPVLLLAAQALMNRARNGELDLSTLLVVTPGARAGRVLDSLLSKAALAADILYVPPRFLTPGGLIGALYDLPPSLDPMHERMAWTSALRHSDSALLTPLVATLPPMGQPDLWGRYAGMFSTTCSFLAGENLRPGEVPARVRPGGSLVNDIDPDRWTALEYLLKRVEEIVAACDSSLSGIVHLEAVRGGLPTCTSEIALIAVSELAGLARAALSKYPGPIHIYIGAPASLGSSFDGLGCVVPERWTAAAAEISDSSIIFADGPTSQAEATFSSLAKFNTTLSPQDVIIATPDSEVVPHLKILAREIGGVRVRDAASTSMKATSPAILLQLIADFSEHQGFVAYTRLTRHPHMEARLERLLARDPEGPIRPIDWMTALDRFGASQAPASIDPEWTTQTKGDIPILRALHRAVSQLLTPLLDSTRTQSPVLWAQDIRALLLRIYEGRRANSQTTSGKRVQSALRAISAALQLLSSTPEPLIDNCVFHAADALKILIQALNEQQIAPDPAPDAIEVVGWLDAAMDVSPIAIITGMNEGVVPQKISTDVLLPESLAMALGISCNATRFGRDAYLLALIEHSRRGAGSQATYIAGRRSADDDPLWPSRLLLPEDTILDRVTRLLTGPTAFEPVDRRHRPSQVNGFEIRPLDPVSPPLALSVSNFKQYLSSPYEFYLDKVLRLKEFAGPGQELDPREFGSLVHAALKIFGDSPAKSLSNEREIAQALDNALDTHIARAFAPDVRPELKIQIELARRRIAHLAKVEANRRRDGWTIEFCEWDKGVKTYSSNGKTVTIRGVIDRIDRNAKRGTWEIIDYKTSNDAKNPDSAHRSRSGEWRDLQLPLYQQLARPLTGIDPVELAYLHLPRDPKDTGISRLTKTSLADADAKIAAVIADILASKFEDAGDASQRTGARAALLGLGLIHPAGARPRTKEDAEW